VSCGTADASWALFFSNPHPMWVYDVSTLRFLEVNGAAEAAYGYSRDEFLAMTLLDIRSEEDRPAVRAALAVASDSLHSAGVFRHRTKSGEEHWAGILSHPLSFSPAPAAGGRGRARPRAARMVTAVDVTESRRAEQDAERRKAVAHYEAVMESLNEGVLLTDLDDTVLFANARLAEMAGRDRDEMRGRPAYEMLLPPDRWDELAARNRSRAAGVAETHEADLLRKDGSSFRARVNAAPFRDAAGGAPVGTIGAVTDVTDAHGAAAALRESERRFRLVTESLSEVVTILSADGSVRFENGALARVLGYAPGEVVGTSVFERVHADDLSRVLADFFDLLERGHGARAARRVPRTAQRRFVALAGGDGGEPVRRTLGRGRAGHLAGRHRLAGGGTVAGRADAPRAHLPARGALLRDRGATTALRHRGGAARASPAPGGGLRRRGPHGR
jgi:PAS domain S-box-containing protein